MILNIAHRGASAHATENTAEAIALAAEMGADGLEVDIRMSADGQAVLWHDADLKRLTGDRRLLNAVSLEELRALPVKGGGTVQTLDGLLGEHRGMRLFLEIKEAEAAQPTAEAVRRAIADGRLAPNQPMIIGFGHAMLAELKRRYREIPMAFSYTETPAEHALHQARTADMDAITIRHTRLTRHLRMQAERLGLPIHVWTVNAARPMRALAGLSLAGIMTDRPDLLARELTRG